jgi:predicted lipoprotein with Yx(FWY)xxD motif
MKRTLAALGAVLISTSTALAVGQVIRTAAGPAFVNGQGMTLYTLSKDSPLYSTCYRKCASVWPPYLVRGYATARGPWTIIRRQDGSRMWAFNGHPVYTYVKDKQPGDAYGNGVHDRWGHWRAAFAGGGRYVMKRSNEYPTRKKLDYGTTGSIDSYSGGSGSTGGGGGGY